MGTAHPQGEHQAPGVNKRGMTGETRDSTIAALKAEPALAACGARSSHYETACAKRDGKVYGRSFGPAIWPSTYAIMPEKARMFDDRGARGRPRTPAGLPRAIRAITDRSTGEVIGPLAARERGCHAESIGHRRVHSSRVRSAAIGAMGWGRACWDSGSSPRTTLDALYHPRAPSREDRREGSEDVSWTEEPLAPCHSRSRRSSATWLCMRSLHPIGASLQLRGRKPA